MVKPDDGEKGWTTKDPNEPESIEQLEAAVARANDRERALGLIAAPLGAIVGVLVTADLINHAKTLGQSTSVYQTLTFVLLGMSLLMLITAWLRKRLFLGILMALYGVSIFNLHYWGFGVPFVLAGAWYLVRAYRLSQKLKLATGDGPGSQRRPGYVRPPGVLPRPNKRYTPRTAPRKRPSPTEPD
jgi:hypothetical protein